MIWQKICFNGKCFFVLQYNYLTNFILFQSNLKYPAKPFYFEDLLQYNKLRQQSGKMKTWQLTPEIMKISNHFKTKSTKKDRTAKFKTRMATLIKARTFEVFLCQNWMFYVDFNLSNYVYYIMILNKSGCNWHIIEITFI